MLQLLGLNLKMQRYCYFMIIKNVFLPFLFLMKTKYILFRWFCAGMLACCSVLQVTGQFIARYANCDTVTSYINAKGTRDPIFIFNQTPAMKKGDLSLQQSELCTFKWYRFNDNDKKFELFDEVTDAMETSKNDLEEGGYKLTVTDRGETTPRDSFVAWLFMNPEFEFSLVKNVDEVPEFGFKNCYYTDFQISPIPNPSSFTYYNPVSLVQYILSNDIVKYTMQSENGEEIQIRPDKQDNNLYLRDYNPPRKDTQFTFRVYDKFGIVMNDRILYRTILPDVTIGEPDFPDESAPVPVKFSCNPSGLSILNREYVWRFDSRNKNGDSIVYNSDRLPPDIIEYTYYTPKTESYQVRVKVTSWWGCTYVTEPKLITVKPPSLEVANVFTPNNDGNNDYFKPAAVSLRRFEIWIYTRTGKRVYYYRGNDLRDWIGWDGRIENSGKEAAEGVYYYVIKAAGWDEPPTRNPQAGPYSGSFHLYR